MTKEDKARKDAKIAAIQARLAEMRDVEEFMLRILDETKLDLMILALGIGHVSVASDA